jgi:hypothetical protein
VTDLRQPDKQEPREAAPPEVSVRKGYEVRDIRVRPILYAGLGLAALGLFVQLAMLFVLNVFASRESKQSAPASPLAGSYGAKAPPAPRLQTEPLGDLGQLRAAEDAALHSYGWVDRQAGIVRIPIERAMDLVAQGEASAPEQQRMPRESGGGGRAP